jgi:3-oxoacyl-[acyl-carrier protein] reductase
MATHVKVALVTGAGRGLGRAMALGLSRAGFCVAITAARNRAELEAVAREAPRGQVYPVISDASRESDYAALVREVQEQLGPVDVLVNNAGRGMHYVSERFMVEPTRFWETDPETWQMVIDTNVNGPFFLARTVTSGMISRGWGRIINISMNHETMRRVGFSPYGPSKAVLESETIIWAQDLAGTGVTVNALLPGSASLTGMIPDEVPPALRQKLLMPEVMVPPLLWLVSPDSDGMTGRRLVATRWRTDLGGREAAEAATDQAGW